MERQKVELFKNEIKNEIKILKKVKVRKSAKGQSPKIFFKFELSLKDNFNSKPLEIHLNLNQPYILSEKFYRMEVSCLVPML